MEAKNVNEFAVKIIAGLTAGLLIAFAVFVIFVHPGNIN
jgi:hypothetical protein